MTTITVILEGHEERAAVSGMLHHFFSNVSATGVKTFHVVVDEYNDGASLIPDGAIITIACKPQIPPQAARHASRTGAYADHAVYVRTTLQTDGEEQAEEADVSLPLLRETIRRQLFNVLSELTGLTFPWGMLTGVRPTDIALRELEQARREGDEADARAAARLVSNWKTSQAKAELAVETAKSAILQTIDTTRGDMIVYVGLPFCPSRCAYCSFITQDAIRQSKALPDYVDAVILRQNPVFRRENHKMFSKEQFFFVMAAVCWRRNADKPPAPLYNVISKACFAYFQLMTRRNLRWKRVVLIHSTKRNSRSSRAWISATLYQSSVDA